MWLSDMDMHMQQDAESTFSSFVMHKDGMHRRASVSCRDKCLLSYPLLRGSFNEKLGTNAWALMATVLSVKEWPSLTLIAPVTV